MAGGTNGNGRRRGLTDINVTPFVDILLVLLVTFMATAVYIAKGKIPIKLPTAASGSPNMEKKTLLILAVDMKGDFLIKGTRVTDQEMKAFIADEVARNPNVEAIISGDKRVKYGRVMRLVDMAKTLGVKQIAAEVEKGDLE